MCHVLSPSRLTEVNLALKEESGWCCRFIGISIPR